MNFEDTLRRHCARAVPIILIDNAIDEMETVRQIMSTVCDPDTLNLTYCWNVCDGLQVANTESPRVAVAERLLANAAKATGGYTLSPVQALDAVKNVAYSLISEAKDDRAGFIFYTGDRVLSRDYNDRLIETVYRLMDTRDVLKSAQSTIFLVGITFNVPAELREHVVVLNAPLPTDDKYSEIVTDCYTKFKDSVKDSTFNLDDPLRGQFVESLHGMSAFAAEQTVYLSTDAAGMHLHEMRSRAIQTINSTRGLSVYRGTGEGFSALGGLSSIKEFASTLLNGRLKIKLIVYVDEIEKVLAGASGAGDTSGVSQNYLGTLLSEMQDTNSLGMLLTGVYGTGKSEFAKRFSEEAETLCIHLDLAGMKDSLVGSSETNLRLAMNTIRSIGGTDGGIVYLATCNRISQLPPELKRRYNLGTFFFYFPDAEERAVIWAIYLKKYGLIGDMTKADIDDSHWTGAEIESCCRLAYLMDRPLIEAAQRIVPVADTAREEIDRLVTEAEGKFLSCSAPGVFTKPTTKAGKPVVRKTQFH